jgi:hypothetical protein
MLPKIKSYGEYQSSNYGVNSLCVDLGDLRLYYSYETIVAYEDTKDGIVCSVNVWTVTTGKHLNWICPNKKLRVKNDDFNKMLEQALKRHIQ